MNSHAVLNWTKTNECSSLTKERQAPTKRMNFCSCCKYPLTPPPLVLQLHLNSKPQRPCWASSMPQLFSSWVCPVRPGLSQGEDDAWCWKLKVCDWGWGWWWSIWLLSLFILSGLRRSGHLLSAIRSRMTLKGSTIRGTFTLVLRHTRH